MERLKSRRVRVSLGAGVGLIVLPALLFTPLIPYLDMVAFAYLHSYPAQASYGPQHYYLFEFTYLLQHMISRAAAEFGIAPATQVLLYYLAQALAFYAALSYILLRLVRQEFVLSMALLLAPLAFSDGIFLWGGPLAFSLAAIPLAVSFVLLLRSELDQSRPPAGWLILLACLGVLSHPFALPFFGVMHTAALAVSPRQRKSSAIVLGTLAIYGLLISRDGSETLSTNAYTALFNFWPVSMIERFGQIFSWDGPVIAYLFGECPTSLREYLRLTHGVELLGLAGTAIVWRRAREDAALRLLAAAYLAFFTLFLTAGEQPMLTLWPQRVLTLTHFLLLGFGTVSVSLILELPVFRRYRMPAAADAALIAVGALLCAWQLLFQYELLPRGKALLSGAEKTRGYILSAGIRNARLMVSPEATDRLSPFCMRAVPFMLFPDPELAARNVILFTEWHVQPRHNTRVPELKGQRQMLLDFRQAAPYEVSPVLRDNAYPAKIEMDVRFGGNTPRRLPADPILTTGKPGDANFLSAVSPRHGMASFQLDRWGLPLLSSPPFFIEPERMYRLDVSLSAGGMKIEMDGMTVWEQMLRMQSLANPRIGQNPLGGTSSSAFFSGSIQPHTDRTFRLALRLGGSPARELPGEPLLITGKKGAANALGVISPKPDAIGFIFESGGLPVLASGPIAADTAKDHVLEVGISADSLHLVLDGRRVWAAYQPMAPLDSISIGENTIASPNLQAKFSGSIRLLQ